jgi:chromosome condensin MukBEF MukE localization factor
LQRIVTCGSHRRCLATACTQQQEAGFVELADDCRLPALHIQRLRRLGLHAVFGQNTGDFAVCQRLAVLRHLDGERDCLPSFVERVRAIRGGLERENRCLRMQAERGEKESGGESLHHEAMLGQSDE